MPKRLSTLPGSIIKAFIIVSVMSFLAGAAASTWWAAPAAQVLQQQKPEKERAHRHRLFHGA